MVGKSPIGARLSSKNLSQKHLCCPLSLRERELEGPVPQAVILILALMGKSPHEVGKSPRTSDIEQVQNEKKPFTLR